MKIYKKRQDANTTIKHDTFIKICKYENKHILKMSIDVFTNIYKYESINTRKD
jgi:hypothetical protein